MNKEKVLLLEDNFGLPLYLFNEKEFCENYSHLVKAIADVYPKYRLAYSYKTNVGDKLRKEAIPRHRTDIQAY